MIILMSGGLTIAVGAVVFLVITLILRCAFICESKINTIGQCEDGC